MTLQLQRHHHLIIRLLTVIFWMLVIFVFSSQPHDVSSAQSTGIITNIQQISGIALPEFLVRKSAHIFLYLVLGLLVADFSLARNHTKRYGLLVSGAMVVGYALTDEFHQNFVSGRAGLWSDVALDSVAGFVGIMLMALVLHNILYRKHISKIEL